MDDSVGASPIIVLLLGLSSIAVTVGHIDHLGWSVHHRTGHTGPLIRKVLLTMGTGHLEREVLALGTYSISALLLTVMLLFSFQGEAIMAQPLVIAILAMPT